jgi:hypothetical protein
MASTVFRNYVAAIGSFSDKVSHVFLHTYIICKMHNVCTAHHIFENP